MTRQFCGKFVIFLAILSWTAEASRSILPKDDPADASKKNSEEILIPEFKGQRVKTACFSDCPPSTPNSTKMLFATTENGEILIPKSDLGGYHYRWVPRLEGTKISITKPQGQHENCVIDCFAVGDGTNKSLGTGSIKSEEILIPEKP